jgi:hypothetical protein
MAIGLSFIHLDEYFHSIPNESKLIINTLRYDSSEDLAAVEDRIRSIYTEDALTVIPQCSCGERKGMYLKKTICPVCNTPVTDIFYNKDPILWFKRLDSTEKFLNPHFYLMFREGLGTGMDLIKWITNTSYNPSIPQAEYLKYIVSGIDGFTRSYNWFIQNIDKVFVTLLNNSVIKAKNKHKNLGILYELYKSNKDILLSEYYPLLNKRMFYIEKNSKGSYTFAGISDAYDLVMTFIMQMNKKKSIQEKSMSRVCELASHLDASTIDQYLGKKTGIWRKHVYGTRAHFTGRAVITSLPGRHKMDEVHLPWGMSVVMFRPIIVNYLRRSKLTHKQVRNKLMRAVQTFDQDISDIFDQMLNDVPEHRIPLMVMRNPSLHRGSVMLLYASVIKRDINDNTMGTSALIAKLPNKDYDGDALNIHALLDRRLERLFKPMGIEYSVPDLTSVGGVSNLFNLTDPGTLTLALRIKDEEQTKV